MKIVSMYKGDSSKVQDAAGKKSGISRRALLIGGGSALGLGLAGFGIYRGLKKLDSILSEEDAKLLKTKVDLYVHNKGDLIKFKVPKIFVEFRGDIFVLRYLQASQGEGPSALIYRANEEYNPGLRIKGDLADRTLDLFNILSQNRQQLETLAENEVKEVKFRNAPTPIIKAGTTYEIPVYTAYDSLNDIPLSARR